MARDQFKNLTEPMYYILLSLKEENYGYNIMNFVKDLTNNRVKIGPGTLYALLSKFLEEGLIKLLTDDGTRKTYIITDKGLKVLELEMERLKILLEDGGKVLDGDKKIKKVESSEKSIFKKLDEESMFFN